MPRPHIRALRTARCTWLAFNVTRLATHRTFSSPASHASVSRLVVSTCVRIPVSGSRLVETAVRTDSCTAAAGVGRVVFMSAILPTRRPAGYSSERTELL